MTARRRVDIDGDEATACVASRGSEVTPTVPILRIFGGHGDWMADAAGPANTLQALHGYANTEPT